MDLAKLIIKYPDIIIWSNPDKNYNNDFSTQTLYLTIDDVINDDSFEEILDVLDEHNVKATFFVISSLVNKNNMDLLVRAVKSGHQLANHGKLNKFHGLYTDNQILLEIIDCEKLLEYIYSNANISMPRIKYFRPGCGYVSDSIKRICVNLGYKIVLGSIYPSDTKLPFPNLLSWYIRTKSKPNDIIILHDRKHLPSTLKKILPQLKKKYLVTCLPR
jgi:peptidoglycan/xylan/chitin deacetylase (PgdA/CDA1 family)